HRRRRRQRAAAWQERHLGRGSGQGDRDRPGAAAVSADRLRRGRAAAAGDESAGAQPRALCRTEGRRAAAVVDSRAADLHSHRRQLRARLERRAEGHGPDHADPDRHGAHRLCAEPRRARSLHGGVPCQYRGRRRRAGCARRFRHHARTGPRGH
ncbi:hypothetical protein OY671_012185, partial [Metschnikowia pulcherrima]